MRFPTLNKDIESQIYMFLSLTKVYMALQIRIPFENCITVTYNWASRQVIPSPYFVKSRSSSLCVTVHPAIVIIIQAWIVMMSLKRFVSTGIFQQQVIALIKHKIHALAGLNRRTFNPDAKYICIFNFRLKKKDHSLAYVLHCLHPYFCYLFMDIRD